MTEATKSGWKLDRYSRVARYYPALLAIAPFIWSFAAFAPGLLSDYRKLSGSIILVSAGFYLIASLARSRGKRVEEQLIHRWGGWPTTIVLRHRDLTIDPVTKARYHFALFAIAGVEVLPAPGEEAANPLMADDHYRSATKKLIEMRRGREFRMIEDENASYGFRRNLLGLKRVAISVALVAAGTTLSIWWIYYGRPWDSAALLEAGRDGIRFPILVCADLIYAAFVLFAVTPRFVEQAAYDYAVALFRSLDG